MVVMIANGDRQHLLRFILLDHEAVEMRFNVPRQKIELEFLLIGLVRFFFLFRWCGLRFGKSRHRDPVAEVLFHELRDLGLQFFRRRKLRWWVLLHIAIQKTSRQKSLMAMIRLNSDSEDRNSFILHIAPSARELPSPRRGGPIHPW